MNPLQAFELSEISNKNEVPQEERPQFEITDMNSLNWAFRKIAALKTQEKEIKSLAATERQRIDEWIQCFANQVCSGRNGIGSIHPTALHMEK